jgi:hypothetical protein
LLRDQPPVTLAGGCTPREDKVQKIEATVFYMRSTKGSHVYQSTDGKVIQYWPKTTLTKPPPDCLIVNARTPTQADLDESTTVTTYWQADLDDGD